MVLDPSFGKKRRKLSKVGSLFGEDGDFGSYYLYGYFMMSMSNRAGNDLQFIPQASVYGLRYRQVAEQAV